MVDRIELPASLAEVTRTDATRLMEEIRQNRAIADSHAHFTKTPYLPHFTGEQKGCEFKPWKSTVESIQKSHHTTSVNEAIRKSLHNQRYRYNSYHESAPQYNNYRYSAPQYNSHRQSTTHHNGNTQSPRNELR